MPSGDFFRGHELSQRVFEAVREAVDAAGRSDIRVTKSQVMFRRRGGCEFAWLPNMYLRRGGLPLVLTVRLQRRDESPRWTRVTETSRGVTLHHLDLNSEAEVDAEVRAWLKEAWEAAA